jgi:2-amino-4-hydroxy-6-hydroxymethyldihydropteridine diphosphokinase
LRKIKNNSGLIDRDGINTAFLSLGGNLGNRFLLLEKATAEIEKRCGELAATSGVYETEAWGTKSAKKYLNKVIALRTLLSPRQLIKQLLKIEAELGRKRNGHQYADREMDIDLLYYNSEIVHTADLQIPHPRLHLRNFVLAPLTEVAPFFVHPLLKRTSKTLLKNSPDPLGVKRFTPLRYICIEGNIGSGKTTLARELAEHFNASLFTEEIENNPLLPLFYSDPGRYAFPLEFNFLLSRFEQVLNHFETHRGSMVVSDYTFYKSLWFAKINLSRADFSIFKKHFETLASNVPQPDLVVYLDTPVNNLVTNIRKRNRTYETDLGEKYLRRVDVQYKNKVPTLPVKNITINIRKYRPNLWKSSIKIIEKFIRENFG